MRTIKGIYKKNIYKSDKGYIIGLFKITETEDEELKHYLNKTITFTGYFHELEIDYSYIFKGDIVEHPRYGTQFEVKEYDNVKPEGKDGLIEFLSSDIFKGVGKKLAEKIVDTLGEDAIDKILKEKECLLLVPSMTTKKAETIYETLNKYEGSHQVVVYLTDLGFSLKDSLAIYNKYKDNTVSIIENNIYKIIDDIDEVNFKKVDEIARKEGIEKDDIKRLKAVCIYVMKDLLFKTGDTYLYLEEIYEGINKYLDFNIDKDYLNEIIEELILEDKLKKDEDRIYIKEDKNSEDVIIKKIKYLLDKEKDTYKKLDGYIEELEKIEGIEYNEEQKKAIKLSLENNITIITGGPGTGKTTIIKTICKLYELVNPHKNAIEEIALLAPTGRASKRMSESTNMPASTIHRFLKWNKENNKFAINEHNKADSKFIIIDEVSMIDLNLLASLFKGLINDVKIVLVGDYHQLPSVSPGQVLKDLIDSEMIDTVNLNTLYRQSEESYIPELAYLIRNKSLDNFLEPKDDYLFLECSSESIPSNIKSLVNQMISKGYDSKKVQVMAPMYIGSNGIDRLNKILQDVFNPKNPKKEEIVVGDIIYRENDKILQLVNMPDLNIYNGDIGYIRYIIPASKSESKKNEIYVAYDNELVKYLPSDFNKIKHGYAISIHKSQGSEFDLVLMPLCRSYYRMLYQKLIYTGITRAKKKLILLGDSNAFRYAVSNTLENFRKTYLKERLQKMYKK